MKQFLSTIIILITLGLAPSFAGDRVALVIGVNDYTNLPKLKNPRNDAKLIAKTLEDIGFDVYSAFDPGRLELDDAIYDFSNAVSQSDIAVVYFAGHGIQFDGVSYLFPVDGKAENARDLRRLFRADELLQDISRAKKMSLLILDACRDNPFPKQLIEDDAKHSGLTRSVSAGRGLSNVQDVPKNVLIAYATQAGNVAVDGDGENSPYALALSRHLSNTSDIRIVLGAVRDDVLVATNHAQEPFTYGSLGGATYSLPVVSNTDPSTIADLNIQPNTVEQTGILANTISTASVFSPAYVAWEKTTKQATRQSLANYSQNHPDSVYSAISRQLSNGTNFSDLGSRPVAWRDLSKNERIDLQRKLSHAGYYSGKLDGDIGRGSKKALSAFASDLSLNGPITYKTLQVILEVADTKDFTASLSGNWVGKYRYPKPLNGVSEVNFEMNLILSQSRISGFVAEPNTFGDQSASHLYANFNGTIQGSDISWKKTYDGTGGVSHTVNYNGKIDRENAEIKGKWSIPGGWSGPFEIKLQ